MSIDNVQPTSSVGASSAAANRAKRKLAEQQEQPKDTIQVTPEVRPDLDKGVAIEQQDPVPAEGTEDPAARAEAQQQQIAEITAAKEAAARTAEDAAARRANAAPAESTPAAEEPVEEVVENKIEIEVTHSETVEQGEEFEVEIVNGKVVPVADNKKTQLAVSAGDAAAAQNSAAAARRAKNQPAAVTPPPAAPVVETPPAAPVVEEPPAAPVVEEAPAAPVVEEAPAAPVVETPPAAPVVETPPAAPVVETPPAPPTPAAEDKKDQPPVSAEDAAKAQQSAAAARRAKNQPAAVTPPPAAPVVETPPAAPVVETPPAAPVVEEAPAAPVADNKGGRPVVEQLEELLDEPEDETAAAIRRRLEAQQRQIREQQEIIRQLRENERIIQENQRLIESLAQENPEDAAPAVTPAKPGENTQTPEDDYKKMSVKELKKLTKFKDESIAQKAKAELERRKEERKWTAPELTDNERSIIDAAVAASGSDKPFYKNLKAQNILKKQLRGKNEEVIKALDKQIEEAETQEEKDALKLFRDALGDKKISRKYTRAVVKDLKIGDRVEHTIVVDSNQEKQEMKELLDDEAKDYRVRTHNKRYMKHNAQAKATMADNDVSSHQAVYEQVSGSEDDPRRISGDRTFEKSEVITVASYASDDKTRYMAARNELKKLGYNVDDDMAKKIIMPIIAALAGAAGGFGAGTLFTGGLSTIVKATATALAEASIVIPELGISTASSSTSTASTSLKVNHWQNAAISSAAAALIAVTMFGSEDEEIDLLRNHDRCDLFRDVSNGNGGTVRAFEQGSYGNKSKTKATKAILREIDKLNLTDEEKVALLNEAAGNKGLGKLSSKELILAYIKGMDQVAGAEKKSPKVKPCETCDEPEEIEETPCPCEEEEEEEIPPVQPERIKYETEDVEGTKTRTVATVKWGGPYHYAQFYLVDGKPIKYKSPEYNAIIAKLNNGAMMEANGRKDRVLLEEIDLGNNKVAKLVSDERILEIRRTFQTAPGGKDVRYKSVTTKDGYTILYKIEGDRRTEVKRGTKAAMEAECARLNQIEEDKMNQH